MIFYSRSAYYFLRTASSGVGIITCMHNISLTGIGNCVVDRERNKNGFLYILSWFSTI